MAKKSAPKKSKSSDADVETYLHPEAKRKNIPTAENQKLVADDDKVIKKLRWPRNPDLDPQLVWRGKDFEPDPLEVDAPPIYIQEKIQPRAIIEELRRQTKARRPDETPQSTSSTTSTDCRRAGRRMLPQVTTTTRATGRTE
jgi:adenine-specific DNA-methyltransferase